MAKLDFNWITPNVAQGSYPSPLEEAFQHADTIVFCAEEKQPRAGRLPPGKRIVKLGFDDDIYRPIPPEVGQIFHAHAHQLAKEVSGGRRVLITCAMGLNRSGLMSALTIMYAYRMRPTEAIQLIRSRRSRDALMNPIFERWILNQRVL